MDGNRMIVETYNNLRQDILKWKLEAILYRYLNIALYFISRLGVPTLTSVITANLLYQTVQNGFVSEFAMIILSVCVIVLSGIDTLFRPGEKKIVAHKQYNNLSDLIRRLDVDYLDAPDDEKGKIVKIISDEFKKMQNIYSTNGFR